jgi:hypothetical protein
MKIVYVPPSPKAGQSEHLPPHTANTLIAAGFAEAVPLPPRNDPSWLAERNEQAKLAERNPEDAGVKGVEWGVKARNPMFPASSKTHIIKRVGVETFFFAAPPADCPRSIGARWQQLIDAERPEPPREATMERYQREQWEREQKENQATAAITRQPVSEPLRFI